jgi:hypothetical protein
VLVPVLIILTVSWGALAIGGVYAWAYIPLGIACTALAIISLARRLPVPDPHYVPVSLEGGINRPLLAAVALVGLVIGAQLVPLPYALRQRVSPGTDAFLARYDMQYRALQQTVALLRNQGDRAAPASSPAGSPGAAGAPGTAGPRPEPPTRQPGWGSRPISIDPGKTGLGLALFGGFALLALGLARGLTARDARRVVPALVGVGVVLALVGIITKATWSGKIYGLWEPYNTAVAPFGPFVNRNHFAGWMLMALPLGLGYFLALAGRGMRGVKPEWHYRILWFASADANRVILVGFGLIVMGVSLVMTLSRSGITCFTIALLLSGLAALARQARRSGRALVTGYLLLVFVLAVGWAGLDAIAARFESAGLDYGERTKIWTDTMRVFHDFPILGSGLDTLGTAMFVYQTSELESHIVEAHNDYVQLLAEGGVVLTGAAAVLLLIFVRQVRRRFRHDSGDQMTYWIRVGAVTGLVAIALQEVVEFSLQMPGNAALFAVLMAIAVAPLPHRRRVQSRRTTPART